MQRRNARRKRTKAERYARREKCKRMAERETLESVDAIARLTEAKAYELFGEPPGGEFTDEQIDSAASVVARDVGNAMSRRGV
jgi:hypothetical protein